MLLDASDDHRFECRTCHRPRLRMVALLPEGPTRRKLMAGRVCVDRHPKRPGVTYDLPCKSEGCPGTVTVAANERDQHEPCSDCHRLHSVTYDGEGLGYTARLAEPPNWNEVAGDLHYHERN